MNKFEEYLSMAKISDFIHRKELEEEKKKTVCLVFAIIAGVAAIAAIAFGIYKYLSREDDVDDFEDDFEDDFDDEAEPEETMRPVRNVQTATSEAHELLKKEIAAATADDAQESQDEYYDMPARTTERTSFADSDFDEDELEEEEPVEIKKLAIPRRTATQLANRARKAGDAPDVVRDSITKVTLFDYSDIIAGDNDDDEEE